MDRVEFGFIISFPFVFASFSQIIASCRRYSQPEHSGNPVFTGVSAPYRQYVPAGYFSSPEKHAIIIP
jgi:hypothetical protein